MTPSAVFQSISVSHLGFLCEAPKRAVFPAGGGTRFVLQDNLSLANLLQALANLIPREVPAERKLGLRRP